MKTEVSEQLLNKERPKRVMGNVVRGGRKIVWGYVNNQVGG